MKYLLISPIMFDYYKDMISFLEERGNSVIWYYDSILFSLFDKIKNKINRNYMRKKFDKYWNSIIEANRDTKFDKIVLIFGDKYIQRKHIESLLNTHKEAKTIYYAWDSIKNYPNILEYYKLFDKYMSFDKEDCRKYGLEFRPLYYSNKAILVKPKYDYCSIMTYGYKKANNYRKIKNLIPDNLLGNEFLYVRSHKSLFINKIMHRDAFKFIDKKNFRFKPLNREETNRFMANSKVVIDAPLANQNGLTIRTFEALNLRRKLITTNKNIKEYDFYSPNNIFIVDDNRQLDISFFQTEFDEEYLVRDYYSFETFMREVFEIKL